MKFPKALKIEHSSLRSKVARRIFLLFILCSLLPLGTLAYFSFDQVTKQLYSQAQQQLDQECKTAEMTIIERSQLLETDFKTIIADLQIIHEYTANNTYELSGHYKTRFRNLALVTGSGKIARYHGTIENLPELSRDEKQHITSGKTLVTTRYYADRPAGIFMVRALDPVQTTEGLVYGEINHSSLWVDEAFLPLTTKTFILDETSTLLFSSFPDHVPFHELNNAMQKNSSTGHFTWSYNGNTYMAHYRTVFLRPQFFNNMVHVISRSESSILEPLNKFRTIFFLIVLLTFLVVLLMSFSQIRKYLIPIELLKEATRRIAGKNFRDKVDIRSNDEFEDLGRSFNEMADSLENHLNVMNNINGIGLALSAEKDTAQLMDIILQGTKNIINADGAVLYTIAGDGNLKLSLMSIDSLNREAFRANIMSSVPLYDQKGEPNTTSVAAYSVFHNTTINIPDIYHAEGFDFSDNIDFDRKTGYRSQSFLSVPMKNHEDTIIGVLQLINAQDKISGRTVPFTEDDQRMAETLASQTAITLTKNQLIEDFKKLFDSLIELIAKAIDAKSNYTAGHCRRVPDLTMMLAKEVCRKKDGPFRDISFTDQELYELKVAALLHDCGKVTTPIHIVDKATKLETIIDRIHWIDTRFEILRRDMKLALLQKKLDELTNGDHSVSSELESKLAKQMRQLNKDKEFLWKCNKGTEFMDKASQARVREIADTYKWVTSKGEERSVLSDDELHNLSIPKGTLTEEERNIVNYHVTVTANMLESLPYPKSLRNVPGIATVHHERMDGKGYPKGLTKEHIPLQGKILAIADIFEALTAKDRPYKKRKTLMEALNILGSMKKSGHIDPDLFDLFISEKVYLAYANKYLSPVQIDRVETSEIPGYEAIINN